MNNITAKDTREKFKFLDKKTASEPHIFEVLNVILTYQMQAIPSGTKPLATLDSLKKSRKIKIPFTTTRGKTIEYLTDLLQKRYPNHIRPIYSFKFEVDESSKKLTIIETTEFTVMISNEYFDNFVSIRDKSTLESLSELLEKYRFFNLSKLIKNAVNKSELSRIIKQEVGNKIFTFKNFSIDSNKIEWAEDFCFHIANYESVKKSLNIDTLKEIISTYSDSVKKGLNKFGILSPDFSDYRDTKLPYIFNVLLEDVPASIAERDIAEIKNTQSLVTCLNKADKVLNPILILNDDIIKYIRENKICTETEIVGAIMELSEDLLKNWANPDNLKTNTILYHTHENGETYLMDGTKFFDMISEHNQVIVYQPEKMEEMTRTEKRKMESMMEILYKIVKNLFATEEPVNELLGINVDKLQTLKKIIIDYENHINMTSLSTEAVEAGALKQREKFSIFKAIGRLIKSFFGFFTGRKEIKSKTSQYSLPHERGLSQETNNVYRKAININAPVIPLSEFIDLTPENDSLIEKIIDELRENNLKIVIPIYHARKNLYPKKSQKILLPDIEYLLVSLDLLKSPEIIRNFTDSLVGYKLKDELIPANAIMAIEKYLLTIHRQKKKFFIKQ